MIAKLKGKKLDLTDRWVQQREAVKNEYAKLATAMQDASTIAKEAKVMTEGLLELVNSRQAKIDNKELLSAKDDANLWISFLNKQKEDIQKNFK